jgi:hypothetical protein
MTYIEEIHLQNFLNTGTVLPLLRAPGAGQFPKGAPLIGLKVPLSNQRTQLAILGHSRKPVTVCQKRARTVSSQLTAMCYVN